MKRFDVQGIELTVSHERAYAFISDPEQLPKWTRAFARVSPGRAVMRTPSGDVDIRLEVLASAEQGTIDWRMTFPDGSVAAAFSRLVPTGPGRCVYSFVLTPPPGPLEKIEGALEAQSVTLAGELRTLRERLEDRG